MKRSTCLFFLLCLTVLFSGVHAEEPINSEKPLGFLELGRDYAIRFSDSCSVFKLTKTGIGQGKHPSTWKVNLQVNMFTVRKHARGSWVLLEHPKSLEDAANWNLQKMAIAQLTKENTRNLEKSPDGKEQLAKLQESAKQQIQTSTTWVNLDHAVAISEISSELVEVKINVNTSINSK
ncbi:hypothetical protein N9L06_04395 [Mariniblastus sp.]|nr:hypothetical protein [Mariniblastus sp.]